MGLHEDAVDVVDVNGLGATADCFDRAHSAGHVTGSALVVTPSLDRVIGANVKPWVTDGHLPAALRRLQSEMQMLLYNHPVNDVRMEVAARELRTSTKKIIEICFDCGLQNLAHFYKLFRQKFGTTPRLYRARHQAVVR